MFSDWIPAGTFTTRTCHCGPISWYWTRQWWRWLDCWTCPATASTSAPLPRAWCPDPYPSSIPPEDWSIAPLLKTVTPSIGHFLIKKNKLSDSKTILSQMNGLNTLNVAGTECFSWKLHQTSSMIDKCNFTRRSLDPKRRGRPERVPDAGPLHPGHREGLDVPEADRWRRRTLHRTLHSDHGSSYVLIFRKNNSINFN